MKNYCLFWVQPTKDWHSGKNRSWTSKVALWCYLTGKPTSTNPSKLNLDSKKTTASSKISSRTSVGNKECSKKAFLSSLSSPTGSTTSKRFPFSARTLCGSVCLATISSSRLFLQLCGLEKSVNTQTVWNKLVFAYLPTRISWMFSCICCSARLICMTLQHWLLLSNCSTTSSGTSRRTRRNSQAPSSTNTSLRPSRWCCRASTASQ